jgi:hypothetical protein
LEVIEFNKSTCGGRVQHVAAEFNMWRAALQSGRDLALVFSSHNSYYSRSSHAGSIPPSPPVHTSRPRSPTYHGYPPNRVQVTTGPTGTHRSPHAYPREPAGNGPPGDRETGWERREWERGSSRRHVGSAYLHHGPSPPPRVLSPRARSPSQTSPMLTQPSRNYWDSRPTQPPPLQSRSS